MKTVKNMSVTSMTTMETAHDSVATGHHSKQSDVPWTKLVTVWGWSGVENVFKRFAKDCSHMSLISRDGNISSTDVTYRQGCACSNTIQCP